MTSLLDPTTWPVDTLTELVEATGDLRAGPAAATYSEACVVASTGPLGAYAGRRALEAGGSAIDAALATAITQIASAAGCWVSYAGILSLVCHDATTGETLSLDGGFQTFRGETDPLTIPSAPEPSGRTALVPGFFAAAEAAHRRFGRLPWADLFVPAIWIAEGMVLGTSLSAMIAMRKDVLLRTPEARAALCLDDGLPQAGDVLCQPELARTLRWVAECGARYIYDGPWAERFVEVVTREGGRVTLDDLSGYEATWSRPLAGTVHGADVATVAAPHTGGAALLEGLKIASELNLGDPAVEPEALHLLVQTARTTSAFTTACTPDERVRDEHAQAIAKRIRETGTAVVPSQLSRGTHSDFVCVVDADGSAVALCHSINTGAWGSTGIFVDGISVPDAASFQQQELALLSAGERLPNPMNPAIAFRDGAPVLVSSSIGAGLIETTLSCVHRHLAAGVALDEVVAGPLLHGVHVGVPVSDSINNDIGDDADTPPSTMQTLVAEVEAATAEGVDVYEAKGRALAGFEQSVTGVGSELATEVSALGTALKVHGPDDIAFNRGYWGGISLDPVTGARTGARTGFVNSRVEGL